MAKKNPWNKVLQQAAADPAYRKRLKRNPGKVLAEAGIEIDPTVKYVVREDPPDKVFITLPPFAPEPALATVPSFGIGSAPEPSGLVTRGPHILGKIPPK